MFNATAASSLTKMSSLVSGVGTDANIYDDPQDADIPSLLDSRYHADKAQGLKHLIALMAQGKDVSNYFPQVIKGVASQSLEVKKLVYIYLVHYADKRADEALLSINSFQRDLSDINPMVRAWALRAMSGIKVRAVVPVVVLAVNKCARDPSAYVRRCAANAIYKIYSLDEEQDSDTLVELVSLLLNDNSAAVIGAAAATFLAVCPDQYSLLKNSFRKICNLLPDVDEWGQVALMEILLGYTIAKHGLTGKNAAVENGIRVPAETTQDFYEQTHSPVAAADDPWELKMLLNSAMQLLSSRNSAVVVQGAKVLWFLSPAEELSRIVKPLIFLLRSSYEAQYMVLSNILSFTSSNPSLFQASYQDFFLMASDAPYVQAIKLDILANIVTDDSAPSILQELEAYIRSAEPQLAANAVNVIGRCALKLDSTAALCTKGLLILATNALLGETRPRSDVAVQAVLALRAIVQRHPKENEDVLLHLLQNLQLIKEPKAREVVVWILGEHAYSGPTIARVVPHMLKHLAKGFSSESDGTKLQILYCFSKILLSSQERSKSTLLALDYVLSLGSSDPNYDVRDRTRMLRVLIGGHLQHCEDPFVVDRIRMVMPKVNAETLSGLAKSVFLNPKVVPVLPSLHKDNSSYLPGTMSQVVGHRAPGYRPLPDEKSLEPSPPVSPRSPRTGTDAGNGPDAESDYSGSNSSASASNGEDYSTDGEEVAQGEDENVDFLSLSDRGDVQEVMPSVDLEAWLGPELPRGTTTEVPAGYTMVTCRDVGYEPKRHVVLDFTKGDGLEVQFCFTRDRTSLASGMVPLRLFFHNRSTETIDGISVKDSNESALVSESSSLEPDGKLECDVQVDISRGTLKVVKLIICLKTEQIPIKIFPEPGELLGRHELGIHEFLAKDCELSGMHNSSCRVTVRGAPIYEIIICKVLEAANVFLVAALKSDPSFSLEESLIYFSGQTLSGTLCLITVSTGPAAVDENNTTIKVGCEDSLFGLALLNHLDKSLSDS